MREPPTGNRREMESLVRKYPGAPTGEPGISMGKLKTIKNWRNGIILTKKEYKFKKLGKLGKENQPSLQLLLYVEQVPKVLPVHWGSRSDATAVSGCRKGCVLARARLGSEGRPGQRACSCHFRRTDGTYRPEPPSSWERQRRSGAQLDRQPLCHWQENMSRANVSGLLYLWNLEPGLTREKFQEHLFYCWIN